MNNAMLVKVLDSTDYLAHEQAAVWLGQVEIVSSNSLEELPAVQVLHHQDNFTGGLEGIYKPE